MDQFWEGVTHLGVIVFYSAALVMGLMAHDVARRWAMKVATMGVFLAAAGWLVFYLVLVETQPAPADTIVLWSRVFHTNTATWLFIMAFLIRRSERYEVVLDG